MTVAEQRLGPIDLSPGARLGDAKKLGPKAAQTFKPCNGRKRRAEMLMLLPVLPPPGCAARIPATSLSRVSNVVGSEYILCLAV